MRILPLAPSNATHYTQRAILYFTIYNHLHPPQFKSSPHILQIPLYMHKIEVIPLSIRDIIVLRNHCHIYIQKYQNYTRSFCHRFKRALM